MHTDNRPPQPTGARSSGVPSRRTIGALVASALAIGLLAGASLAPAPASSLASSSTIVTRLLALLAASAGQSQPSPAPSPPTLASTPASAANASASVKSTAASATRESSAAATAPSEAGETVSEGSSGGSEKGEGEKKPVRLPPISHVWLIVLSGTSFAEASAQPASYPYLTGQLVKQGTLLERYSAIESYELAGDAALLTGGVGESLSTISESACGAPATAGTNPAGAGAPSAGACPSAGGQAEADSFLQRVAAAILTSAAYTEHGLVVVTFGAAAQELGPPALAATTLAAQPAAGALLLSLTLKAGGHSSEAFNSLAPRESLERIFGHS